MVRPFPFMAEAQRLVGSQCLIEATELIQKRLGSRMPIAASTPDAFTGPSIELTANVIEPAGHAAQAT